MSDDEEDINLEIAIFESLQIAAEEETTSLPDELTQENLTVAIVDPEIVELCQSMKTTVISLASRNNSVVQIRKEEERILGAAAVEKDHCLVKENNWISLDVLPESDLASVVSNLQLLSAALTLPEIDGSLVTSISANLNATVQRINKTLDDVKSHYEIIVSNNLLDRHSLETIQAFMMQDITESASLNDLLTKLVEEDEESVEAAKQNVKSSKQSIQLAKTQVEGSAKTKAVILPAIPLLIGLPLAIATGGLGGIVLGALTGLSVCTTVVETQNGVQKARQFSQDCQSDLESSAKAAEDAKLALEAEEINRVHLEQQQAWQHFSIDEFLDHNDDQHGFRRSMTETEKLVKECATVFASLQGSMQMLNDDLGDFVRSCSRGGSRRERCLRGVNMFARGFREFVAKVTCNCDDEVGDYYGRHLERMRVMIDAGEGAIDGDKDEEIEDFS